MKLCELDAVTINLLKSCRKVRGVDRTYSDELCKYCNLKNVCEEVSKIYK